ncbi:glycosyltransferase family 2 protein [Halobacterium salinarum]|uniref:Glycosyl transferase family 2 n=1 Tax=Halobacterium salinarum (strain ATCC 33171 / DSM 3754 / JCM 8978 / NBRC 102687 / NCIMB 764 / 91-R6) TaxID=2597657 RepID=A0A4D6GT10_HALS9|nr:glycosyltransferase family A protein [Halobacterium salinarum]QCC44904.1 putative glycosyltransferase, type 2 [Halobacterium salinarum]TYO73667.1 Glycosyl transferase family 2 [Halobacterium salinarum DSM 3754]
MIQKKATRVDYLEQMISVVLPVYNQPELLREALQSVQKQSLENVEVVVVDDASEDAISHVVNEFGEWARLICHETNRGAAAARNTGIEHAEGKYVAFLDADDIWEPTKLEQQLVAFEHAEDSVGLVYTGFVQYELDGSEWEQYPEARGNIYVEELERDLVNPTSTVMVQRDVLEEVGGFDTNLPSRQDYDLWIRITEHYEVDYVDEILVDKREQPDSISKDFKSRLEGDLAVFEKVKERSSELGFFTRSRIFSYHHHIIGRDYDSNGDRWKALKHLSLAIVWCPFRPISYVMFVIALFGIDRNGPLLTFAKQFIR